MARPAVFLGGSRNATYPLSTRSRSSSFRAGLLPRQLLFCHRQDPEAIVAEALVLFLQPDYQVGVHRREFPVQFEVRALVEDLFRSSLGEEDCFAFGILHQYGHHAPREVERDLVQLLVLLDHRFPVKIGAIQDGHVEQVLETCLEVANQVAVQEHFLGFPAGDVAMPLEDDAVLGERAGFVGAQDIHAPEVLDGVQPLDDHLLAAHGERTLGKADGDDHGQHLGGEAHGHGHREEKSAFPIVLGEPVDEEYQGHHNRHEPDHEPCKAAETLVEACRRLAPP
jgi:hypothetical protein